MYPNKRRWGFKVQFCYSFQAELSVGRLFVVSLPSHLKLQFPVVGECCWISEEKVSFQPRGGMGGRKSPNPL